jgi:cation transport ATPase
MASSLMCATIFNGNDSPNQRCCEQAVQECGYGAEISHMVSRPLKPSSGAQEATRSEDDKRKAVFLVHGMTCSSCSNAVEHALGGMSGVLLAQVTAPALPEYQNYNQQIS